jgi:hypothetical protein
MEYHQPHAVAKQYLQYAMNYDWNKTNAVEWHEKPEGQYTQYISTE